MDKQSGIQPVQNFAKKRTNREVATPISAKPSPQREPARPLHQLRGALGNQAFGRVIQAKLQISQPGDEYEREADRVADQVMRTPDATLAEPVAGDAPPPISRLQRKCEQCEEEVQRQPMEEEEEEETLQAKETPGRTPNATPDAQAQIDGLRGGGQPLPSAVRAFFEPRFGHDFSQVRIHTDDQASASTRSVQALAYTVGRDVVFGPGQYAPDTSWGQRLIAHELTHTVQQGTATPLARARSDAHEPRIDRAAAAEPLPIHDDLRAPIIARQLDPSMCATDCGIRDGSEGPQSKNTLTIYADKEGAFLLMPLTHDVGHSWLKLKSKSGDYWTYGFWPQTSFDPSNPSKDVEGCVHHPDTAHRPTAEQTFELTDAEFAAAMAKAKSTCLAKPKYNLFGLQCTDFVKQVLDAAGKGSALGFGLIWESPNALNSWIKSNALLIGLRYTAATSAPGGQGQGAFALDVAYTHQFYSTLGNKLRLHWMSRGELSAQMASLSTGVGVELTSQRVFLPRIYLFGGGTAGELTPSDLSGPGQKFGAGPTLGAGLLYNIDEIATVGVEYNLVKDLVNKDPELHRLTIGIGLKF
jgi:hypothetical protein